MRVLIADDHQVVREGLKRILSEASEIKVVGEAGNAFQLMESLRSENWDVVILDINMPGKSGIDVLKEIKKQYPRLPVLILSMYPEDQFALRAFKAGAAGYLTKAGASDELVVAVRKIQRGGKYVSSSVAEKLAEALNEPNERALHERLSDREFQVFKMIAEGKTVGSIAEEISLSVKTISTYRSKILEKMNLRNNAEIMRYAVEHGLKN